MFNRKPVATVSDVETVARELMDKNGQTTTLEIKEELRNRGFWATQLMVSTHMAQLETGATDITFVDNGHHRIYQINASFTKFLNVFSPVATPVTPHVVTQAAAIVNIGDWRVTDPNYQNEQIYNGVTRGQAKYQWVKDTGFSFFMARARKIKD